ncbi:MAG TPA: MFS transporter, partial [Dehalococcoidia bacterium]|nr:MFS transporter [Dehalococcoidia bacterium]
EPIDWAGGLLLAGALGTLLLGITKGQEWGWTSTSIVGLFGLTAMLSIAFLSVERTVSHPIVDLGEFKSPVLAATNVGALFGLVPLGAFVFLMPFYLQGPQGYSAQESGLIMIPYPLANILGAAVSGRLARRFLGPGVFSSMGLALIIIGFFLMAEMDSDAGIADIAWRSAIAGAGLGAFQAANTEVVMGSVGPQKRGSASGVLSMFQQTGANVGTAVSGLILSIVVSKEFEGLSGSTIVTRRHFAQLAGQPEQLQELTDAFMNGFGRAFLAMATFAAVAILLSLVTVVRYKREQPAAVPLAPRGMSAEPADLSGSGATE